MSRRMCASVDRNPSVIPSSGSIQNHNGTLVGFPHEQHAGHRRPADTAVALIPTLPPVQRLRTSLCRIEVQLLREVELLKGSLIFRMLRALAPPRQLILRGATHPQNWGPGGTFGADLRRNATEIGMSLVDDGRWLPATKSHGNVYKIVLRRLACNLRRQVSQL